MISGVDVDRVGVEVFGRVLQQRGRLCEATAEPVTSPAKEWAGARVP